MYNVGNPINIIYICKQDEWEKVLLLFILIYQKKRIKGSVGNENIWNMFEEITREIGTIAPAPSPFQSLSDIANTYMYIFFFICAFDK